MCQRGEQRVEIVRALVADAVDEERRCTVDAALNPAPEVVTHLAPIGAGRERASHPVTIKSKFGGVLDQMVVVERELSLEQAVMQLPEGTLRARSFRGLGGMLGVRMNLRQREMAKYKAELASQLLLHLLHDRECLPAIGTLEIAVFHQRQGRARSACGVVTLADRRDEGHAAVLAICLLMRFHEPKPLVDAARDFSQQVGAAGVLQLVHLFDAYARGAAERGEGIR